MDLVLGAPLPSCPWMYREHRFMRVPSLFPCCHLVEVLLEFVMVVICEDGTTGSIISKSAGETVMLSQVIYVQEK